MLTLVLGGPGCGKTTALLNIIDDLLSKGVAPNKIAYLTFTRKAAQEGISRAVERFGFTERDIPYFRTIHSLAFQQLALDPTMVMSETSWKEFGASIGMDLTGAPEGEIKGKPGNPLLSMVQYSRLRKRPLRAVCQDHRINPNEAQYVADSLRLFKRNRNLVDFTDMLEMFQTEGVIPPVDYLIVDEGQDLSTIQWACIERIAERVKDMWVAGDDDQAIYEWAGADVNYFLGLKGKRVVLPISYRLKRNVFDMTQRVVKRIRHRYEKEWDPHSQGGEIERVNSLRHVNLDNGTWYLLARNHYLLAPMREHLRTHGFPYIENWDHGEVWSTNNDNVRAMIYWEQLRKGEPVTGTQAKEVFRRLHRKLVVSAKPVLDDEATFSLEQLRGEHGLHADGPWYDVMRVSPREIEYYRACRQRGEKLLAKPRITLSTIHGVKGGQAENVFLITDMASKCYQNLVRNKSDEETRVFYVATSRAQERLIIQNPMTAKYYDLIAA